MADLSLADLESFRTTLLTRAEQLHHARGLSPRADLAPDRLVEGTLARALRSQTTYAGGGPRPLEAWLLTQLDAHIAERWNDAVAEYLSMLEGYARIRWAAWDLPPQRLDPGDLVSDAWAKAVDQRPSFRGRSEGQYVVWLRTILENHARDEIDRQNNQKRNRRRERSLEAAVQESSARLERFLADPLQSTPSKRVSREEIVARIYAEINRLPASQREVVVLKLQGLTLEQIAQQLGRTKYAVTQSLLTALTQLRQRLRDLEEGF